MLSKYYQPITEEALISQVVVNSFGSKDPTSTLFRRDEEGSFISDDHTALSAVLDSEPCIVIVGDLNNRDQAPAGAQWSLRPSHPPLGCLTQWERVHARGRRLASRAIICFEELILGEVCLLRRRYFVRRRSTCAAGGFGNIASMERCFAF
jgi:hypothetical protein